MDISSLKVYKEKKFQKYMQEISITKKIESKIFIIRNKQIMLDRDLAELYDVSTKALNQSVKRNSARFPQDFMFQLTEIEKNELVTNCDRLQILKHSAVLPFAFTEHGVTALSGVLKSKGAISLNIEIIRTFVAMRKYLTENKSLLQKLDLFQSKLLEHDTAIQKIFSRLDNYNSQKGIFYDGEMHKAQIFIAELIQKAQKRIILIDNYIDQRTLLLLNQKKNNVSVSIYSKTKPNLELTNIKFQKFTKSHDRFLIIDDTLYHVGASLKDAGKKWFAITKLEKVFLKELLAKIT